MNHRLCLLLSLAVLGCENESASRAARDEAQLIEGLGSALAQGDESMQSQVRLPGEHPLSHLDRRKGRALCTEVGRMIDLCAVAGRRLGPAQCAESVATCRAQNPGPITDCKDARFDFPAPCTATVDDYRSCVAAWSKEVSCAFDRISSDAAPEECLPLLQKCPYLQSEFGWASAIVPRCDPDSPARVDDDDDIVGLDCGRPLPARMVTLGDSIASCFTPREYSSCAPDLIHTYLRDHFAPDLQYQSVAEPGAGTADALAQAMSITPGPGHLLVWIYVGGNDLIRCRQPTLPETQACVDTLLAALPAMWREIFAYFDDRARFPDGVSFMLNTQYSPWDQCTHPQGPERGAFAEATLQRFNREIIMQPALERANVVAIDQYPDFLGHAGNANRRGCPHCYRDDNSVWLFDGTHPNNRGNQHIAEKWQLAIDRAYGSCE